MIKNIFLFVFTFVAGAAIALAIRASAFKPYQGEHVHASVEPSPAMVANAPVPATPAMPSENAPVAGQKTVNTLCAICGMEVDPDIPPAMYQGKLIGFGCSACPAKFAADPDRYGPHALHNMKAP